MDNYDGMYYDGMYYDGMYMVDVPDGSYWQQCEEHREERRDGGRRREERREERREVRFPAVSAIRIAAEIALAVLF